MKIFPICSEPDAGKFHALMVAIPRTPSTVFSTSWNI
jgi:hypothetical protein